MTLPTGVSTFLLECLDVDSTADYNTDASSSLSSCPSPETFRDDGSERSNFYPEGSGKYKNSTLLDSSKALAIDKIQQISNLSAILEPVLEDFQDQCTRRQRPYCDYTSSALSVSTTLAGKKVYKIAAARERTPDLKSGITCSSPLGPERKPASQTATSKRLKPGEEGKKRVSFEAASSVGQFDAPGDTSARSAGLAAQEPPPERTDAVEPVCNGKVICCIVRASPGQRRSRPHQIPANRRAVQLPRGVPEDNITSTKNWTCCKHR
ncbi:MEIKN protein, partial [Eurystomus gularis]|nr:MEIKN protein [Eurystomus gularis]